MKKLNKGFTLIELLIVVAMIAIIASLLIGQKAQASTPNWQVNGHKHYGQMLNQTQQRKAVIQNERRYSARKNCTRTSDVKGCIAFVMSVHESNDKELGL